MAHHTVFAPATRLTTDTSGEVEINGAQNLAIWTVVTAFTGGTNVTMSLEGWNATARAWGTIKTFTARTATGTYRDVVLAQTDGALPIKVRVKATVSGTFSALAYSVGLDATG